MRIITFQEFLKKYSTISNRFIDEYYALLLNDNIDSFYINLEDVEKWLKLNKVEIKKILLKNFKKNVDYKIYKKKEIILLNPSTFKKICMISKSKKAEEVREYFMKIEENLFKYKEYIINKLKRNIK